MKENILNFIKRKGPIVPTDLATELKIQSFFASAYLSDLVQKKEIFISNLKMGSSPLYYLLDQKEQLENFISHLNEKDRRAFEELKINKVLRDKNISPLLRVSLKQIKDFAIPLEVTFENKKEIFWKFYNVKNDEVSNLIKKLLSSNNLIEKEVIKEKPKKEVDDSINKVKNVSKKTFTEVIKDKIISSKSKPLGGYDNSMKEEISNDSFFKSVVKFFEKKEINIVDYEIIKKNSEIDLIIEIPSVLGVFLYVCKAKNKKKLNESDLTLAYALGELKKLPSILITPGELTKKAKEKLEKDYKKIKIVSM